MEFDLADEAAMRVLPDAERATSDGWTCVLWPDKAIAMLESSLVEVICLDHDLGDDAWARPAALA